MARCEENDRDMAYRFYISKSLQLIPQSKYLKVDFMDMINPKPTDNRAPKEIAADIIEKAGLILV